MARDSVSSMPVLLKTSMICHMVRFSRWSGWLGYPGAGRIPWKRGIKTSVHTVMSGNTALRAPAAIYLISSAMHSTHHWPFRPVYDQPIELREGEILLEAMNSCTGLSMSCCLWYSIVSDSMKPIPIIRTGWQHSTDTSQDVSMVSLHHIWSSADLQWSASLCKSSPTTLAWLAYEALLQRPAHTKGNTLLH